MERVRSIRLRWLNLPLIRPYQLSYRTFEAFEPFLVVVEDTTRNVGFADGHISPGSSMETRDGGWSCLRAWCQKCVGLPVEVARDMVLKEWEKSKVAATALVSALEVLGGDDLISLENAVDLPLLTPINQKEPKHIRDEIEEWLERGFRTFKIKVGKDVDADLQRVAVIQQIVNGAATLRIDANRAYSRADGVRFAAALNPEGIELFEQPCDAADWEANAAVAAASSVSLMLDEPICTLDDIARAAEIKGIGFCKLKLKRFGGLRRLREGLEAVRAHGMEPVLGDGLGSEVHAWLEACVASRTIENAGEFNGFLKTRDRLFTNQINFENGAIRLPKGYRPKLDMEKIVEQTMTQLDFAM